MEPSAYMKILNEIEEAYPVNQWTYQKVYIWPLIRIILGFQLHDLKNGHIEKREIYTNVHKIKQILLRSTTRWHLLKSYLLDREHNDSTKRDSKVVILGDTWDRRIEIDGKWFNVFIDPFLLEFETHGITPLILEATPKPICPIPRFSKSVFIQPSLDKIKIQSSLIFHFVNKPCLQFNGYNEINQYLAEKNLDVRLLLPKEIRVHLNRLFLLKNYFKKILKQTRAKLGITVDYYHVRGMAWCLACHELGIPSMDIQHGVAGNQSCAYGSWENMPVGGYQLLPRIFWAWSKEDGEAIHAWSSEVDQQYKAIVGGNLWIKLWKENFMGVGDIYSSKVQQIKQQIPVKSHILYTMQEQKISPLVLDAISKNKDYFWWIRVHPTLLNQVGSIKDSVKRYPNVEVENASKLPLFSILASVDMHVTGWSATVFDAKSFGIPSIIMNDTVGKDWFKTEIENGWVKISMSASSLLVNLKAQVDFKKKKHNHEMQDTTSNGISKLLDIVNRV